MRKKRDPKDDPGLRGTSRPFKLGLFRIRTKLILLFGLLMAGYVLLIQLLRDRHGAVLFAGLAAFILGIGLVVHVSGMVTRPIVQLTRTAEKLAGGDLRPRSTTRQPLEHRHRLGGQVLQRLRVDQLPESRIL